MFEVEELCISFEGELHLVISNSVPTIEIVWQFLCVPSSDFGMDSRWWKKGYYFTPQLQLCLHFKN